MHLLDLLDIGVSIAMQKVESRLTVFFDNPFWVGVYERVADGKLEACKITFGAEPKDDEVYEFLLLHWNTLRFSPLGQIIVPLLLF